MRNKAWEVTTVNRTSINRTSILQRHTVVLHTPVAAIEVDTRIITVDACFSRAFFRCMKIYSRKAKKGRNMLHSKYTKTRLRNRCIQRGTKAKG